MIDKKLESEVEQLRELYRRMLQREPTEVELKFYRALMMHPQKPVELNSTFTMPLSGDRYAAIARDVEEGMARFRFYAQEMRVRAYNLTQDNTRLRAALLVAEHGLTTSHGLMTYDDGTPAGAKQHFRLDNTEELDAIKAALKVRP